MKRLQRKEELGWRWAFEKRSGVGRASFIASQIWANERLELASLPLQGL
jgi:hypothetical protein